MKERIFKLLLVQLWYLWSHLKLGSGQIDMISKSVIPDDKFSQLICKIAHTRDAQVNIVYKIPEHEELNIENWNQIYQCLAQLPVIIRDLNGTKLEPIRSSSSLNIYFVTTPQMMEKVVDFLNPFQRWKHAHRYLFVWLMEDSNLLQLFFEKVWQKNILLAVAAVRHSQQVYTFEPFASTGFRIKIIKNSRYFYDKLKNFHHNELRITMFTDAVRAIPIDGNPSKGFKRVDGWVARTVAERLNATARYMTPVDNETYGALNNGSFTGSLKDISSGLTHIGFNFRYTLDHVKEHVEELYPYQKRLLYLIVPAAEMRPEYLIFANAFTYSLWRLLLLNFCLILLVFKILKTLVERLPNHNRTNSPKHWLWYEIVEMFMKTQLGEPVEGFSRISSLRQFLIAWILFSYVVTSIYFAKLESSFVHPIYEPELNNLKDLGQLKVPIYSFDVVFQAIKVSLDPQIYQLIDKNSIRVAQNVTADEFALALVRKRKNVALIWHDELAKELLAHTYNDETKRSSFHIVKEYLRSLPSSYVLTKGSPFIHKFQTIVSSFYEHGFIAHWLEVDSQRKSSYSHNSEEFFEDLEDDFDLCDYDEGLSSADTPVPIQRRKKVVLNLDILQGAFYLWFAGICLSSIGFALEHFHLWRKRKANRVDVLQDLSEIEANESDSQ